MVLDCIVYQMPDNLFDESMTVLRQICDQEQVACRIQMRTDHYEDAAEILKARKGICFLLIYLQSSAMGNNLSGLKLGQMAMRSNRDNYVVYLPADSRTMISVAPYCTRAAGLLVASAFFLRGGRMLREIFRDYKALTANDMADDRRILLKLKGSVTHVRVADICAVIASEKMTEVHTLTGTYRTYDTIAKLQEVLPANEFLLCHRGCLINQTRIQYIDYRQMEIILMDGTKAPVARSSRKKLKEITDGLSGSQEEGG